MRLLFATDLHVSKEFLPSLLEIAEKEAVERIVVGGDLIPRDQRKGSLEEKISAQRAYLEQELVPRFERFRGKHPDVQIYLDMGNDDFAANRDVLKKNEGGLFHLLHMEKHPLTNSIDIIGYMCVPPTPFSLKDWEKPDAAVAPVTSGLVETSGILTSPALRFVELDMTSPETIEKDMDILSDMVERPFVFVSHSPPYGTDLDLLGDGVSHVGSRSIRQFIEMWVEKERLIASYHGHIHESPEVSGKSCWMAGDTPCYNPGQPGGELCYLIHEIP